MARLWTIDYETLDLSQYDNLQNAAGLASASAGAAKTGLCGMEVLYNGAAVVGYGQMLGETIQYNCNFATHWRVSDTFTNTNYTITPILGLSDGAVNCLQVGIQTDGSGIPYRVTFTSSIITGSNWSVNIADDAWHWVYVNWYCDNPGGAIVYIDGTERFNDVDTDTTGYEIDVVKHGSISGGTPADGSYMYFDNFIADTAAISEPGVGGGESTTATTILNMMRKGYGIGGQAQRHSLVKFV